MSDSSDARRMGRILHQGMEEVLGKEGLRAVLEAAEASADAVADQADQLSQDEDPVGAEFIDKSSGLFSTSLLNQIFSALEEQYGTTAGRGLALRIGRACFPYAIREYGEPMELVDTSFRLLPFPAKLNKFASALAGLFNDPADPSIRVERQGGKLLWRMKRCPFCEPGRKAEPRCLLTVGLAEEALYWMSGGKIFSVEEIACIGRGDQACTLQVDETPLS